MSSLEQKKLTDYNEYGELKKWKIINPYLLKV